MKKIITIIFILLISLSLFPSKVAAQNMGTFSCDLQPGKQRNISTKNQQIISNFLLNAFSYSDLSERLRCDPLIVGHLNDQGKTTTASVYRFCQNLVNVAVLLILLVIAFANILRIKLDTYAIKKSVPLLIFGVIMANFSLPIIRTIVDFSGVLTATFIGEASSVGTKSAFAETLIQTVIKGGAATINQTIGNIDTAPGAFLGAPWGSVLAAVGLTGFATVAFGPFLFMIVMGALAIIFIPAIMFLWLGILFVARIYVLVVLTAVSPLAFASLGFTPLKGKIWGWWWNKFISWTFMTPATFALMWIAIQFYRGVGGSMDIGTYIVTIALLSAALQIPFKMGGSWMQQWNKAVAQPIRDTLLAPFRNAQKRLPEMVDRRLSQPTSIPFTGGRYKIPPVNVARMSKEFMKVVEGKRSKEDANAPAGRFGRRLGNIYTGITPERIPKLFSEYKTGRYRAPQDLDEAVQYADDIASTLGRNPVWDSSLNPEIAKRFLDKEKEALASRDTDKIIGAYLANAKIGRHDVDHDRYLKTLHEKGVDTSFIRHSFEQTIRRSPVGVRTVTPDPAASPQQQEATLRDFIVGLRDDLASQKDKDETIDLLKRMVDILDNIRKENGDRIKPGDNHEEFVEALEKNKNLFGIASTLAQAMQTLPENITSAIASSPVIAQIQAEHGRLAVTEPDKIITNMNTIITDYNDVRADGTEMVDLDDLRQAYQYGMTEPQNIITLPEKTRHLLRYIYDDNPTLIKDEYVTFLKARFASMGIPDYGLIENILDEYIQDLVHPENSDPIKDIDPTLLDAKLTGVIDDADERKKIVTSIVQKMRDYSLHTRIYDNIAGFLAQLPKA